MLLAKGTRETNAPGQKERKENREVDPQAQVHARQKKAATQSRNSCAFDQLSPACRGKTLDRHWTTSLYCFRLDRNADMNTASLRSNSFARARGTWDLTS
jgi:hypothetical protein